MTLEKEKHASVEMTLEIKEMTRKARAEYGVS